MTEELVAGRECGECGVCCIVPAIDKPEIQKAAGIACRHCDSGGCAIYAVRPPVCRSFHCGWRKFDFFTEDWRPDRSGVLAELIAVEGRQGMRLTLLREPLQIVRQDWFIDFIVTGLRFDAPVALMLPGPVSHQGASIMLNTDAMRRAAALSPGAVGDLLEKGVRGLMAFPYQPMTLVNKGNDVSSR